MAERGKVRPIRPRQPTEEELASAEQELEASGQGEKSSWQPVDVDAILNGTLVRAQPTILHLDDAEGALFYTGKTHWMFGETESGKTWVALVAAAEVLNNDGKVIYVDFEDEAITVVTRLMLLGVPKSLLRGRKGRFRYVRPEEGVIENDNAARAYEELLEFGANFVVLDGVTESLGLERMSLKDNDDIAYWQQRLARPLADAGAAVCCIDHVTKARDGRGRFPIGAQHKLAGVTGAAYVVTPQQALRRGGTGTLEVRVAKDRPGAVRAASGPYDNTDRTQQTALLTLDSSEDAVTPRVLRWIEQKPKGEVAKERKEGQEFTLMWNICAAIQSQPGITTKALYRVVNGKDTAIGAAVKMLIDHNPPFVRVEVNRGHMHYLTAENVHQTPEFEAAWLVVGK